MPRPRPDPTAAIARLEAVVPTRLPGGWLPPPLAGDQDRSEPTVEQSWSSLPEAQLEAPPRPAADGPARQVPLSGLLGGLVPAGLRGGRWDPGARGLPVLVVVAVVAAIVAGFVLLRARPQEVVAPPAVQGTSRAEPGAEVVIDVAGKVRRPGIVRLPLGSRVDDALRAAGGLLPGATFDGLNRARKLVDGEQVLVGAPAVSGATAPGAARDTLLSLNAADVAALDALPGIGPVLAQKIVDWRTENGPFASVDQLREVSGIGESKFATLKNKVRV